LLLGKYEQELTAHRSNVQQQMNVCYLPTATDRRHYLACIWLIIVLPLLKWQWVSFWSIVLPIMVCQSVRCLNWTVSCREISIWCDDAACCIIVSILTTIARSQTVNNAQRDRSRGSRPSRGCFLNQNPGKWTIYERKKKRKNYLLQCK